MQAFSQTRIAENGGHGIVEIRDGKIRFLAQGFFVTALNENRATTCGARAIDITPAIAYHITAFRINVERGSRVEDHPWSGLTAIARLAVTLAGVIANFNTIK